MNNRLQLDEKTLRELSSMLPDWRDTYTQRQVKTKDDARERMQYSTLDDAARANEKRLTEAYERGFLLGKEQGLEQGRKEGYDQGYADGYEDGLED